MRPHPSLTPKYDNFQQNANGHYSNQSSFS